MGPQGPLRVQQGPLVHWRRLCSRKASFSKGNLTVTLNCSVKTENCLHTGDVPTGEDGPSARHARREKVPACLVILTRHRRESQPWGPSVASCPPAPRPLPGHPLFLHKGTLAWDPRFSACSSPTAHTIAHHAKCPTSRPRHTMALPAVPVPRLWALSDHRRCTKPGTRRVLGSEGSGRPPTQIPRLCRSGWGGTQASECYRCVHAHGHTLTPMHMRVRAHVDILAPTVNREMHMHYTSTCTHIHTRVHTHGPTPAAAATLRTAPPRALGSREALLRQLGPGLRAAQISKQIFHPPVQKARVRG